MLKKGLVVVLAIVGLALANGPAARPAAAAIDDVQRTNWGLATFGQSRAIASFSALGWAVEEVDGMVFAGGNFLDVTNGVRTERQPYLAAFSVRTGAWLEDFTPTVGGPILALEPGPGGSLFVGGEMDEWNGQTVGTLVKIDPATGAMWPGWNTRLYGGTSVIRDLSLGPDGWLYAGGTFTTASDNGQPQPVSNVVRMNPDTGDIDWSWIPQTQGGGVWGVSASYTTPTVYLAGWGSIMANNQVVGVSTTNATQVTWSGFSMNYPCCGHMFDIQATPHGTVLAVGEQHGAYMYDEDNNMAQIIGHTTSFDSRFQISNSRRGGDFQDIELAGDTLYASCHCWGSHSTGIGFTPSYSGDLAQVSGTPTGSVSSTIAYDARTGVRDQSFNPYMAGDVGGWGVLKASDGCVWIAGGINAVGRPGNQGPGRDLVRLCEEGFVQGADIASPDACWVDVDGATATVRWVDVAAADYVVHRSVDGRDLSWRGRSASSPFADTYDARDVVYTVTGRDADGRKGQAVECDTDLDGDGQYNADDVDDDGDGTNDVDDAFPNNPAEQYDTDGDGVGDNADAFPNDPAEQHDNDGDGVGDNGDIDVDNDGIPDSTEASTAIAITQWPVVGAGVVVDGNSVTSSGNGAWSTQINSARWSEIGAGGDFRLSWTTGQPQGSNMIGLGVNESSASYTDIDYAFYSSGTALYIYESGTYRASVGSIANGSELALEYEAGQLRYHRDGTLIRTVTVAGQPDFYIDSSFNSSNQDYNNFTVKPLDGGAAPNTDHDGDSVANSRDLDSDNDAIADVVEAGLSDANNDYIVDNVNGQGSVVNPPDSDNDGTPDYLDTDSDNDGHFDIAGTPHAALDTNNDGILDNSDLNGGADVNDNGIDDLVEGLVTIPTGPATCLAAFDRDDVTVTWDAVDGAASYIVRRSIDGGASSWRGLTSQLRFTDSNREGDVVYFVVVKDDDQKRSEPTECDSEIVDPVAVLLAPANCVATVSGDTAIVTWAEVENATEYVIYRSVDGGTEFWRGLTEGLTFADAATGGSLTYFVASKNAAKERSDRGACTTVAGPDPEPVILEAPASCTVTVTNAPNDVTIGWDAIADAEAVYVVYRSVNGGDQSWRGRTTETSLDDVLRAANTTYSVVAKVDNQASAPTICSPDVQGA